MDSKVPPMLVELKDVNFWSADGTAHILKGITTTLHPGMLVGILGPSGSGKSTLLKVLTQTATGKWSGDILVNGKSLREREVFDWYLSRIGILFQNQVCELREENRKNL